MSLPRLEPSVEVLESLSAPLTEILTIAFDELAEFREKHRPNEAVGLISTEGYIFALPNQEPSPHKFLVLPQHLAATVQDMEDHDVRPIAFYHSHPTGNSEPSVSDMAMMHANLGAISVIHGTDGISAYAAIDIASEPLCLAHVEHPHRR